MKGGYRQGAGRKPGFAAQNAEAARAFIAQKVSAELSAIVDVLIKQAKGGNIQATKELLDRAYGRVPEAPKIAVDARKIQIVISGESAQRYRLDPSSKNIYSEPTNFS